MIFGLVLVAGLALAGVAVWVAQGYIEKTQVALSEKEQFLNKVGPMVEVFIVNKPKNYGDVLTKDDVQVIYWPESALPETIFKAKTQEDYDALFPENGKVPRYVLRQMEQYEPILAVKVTEPGVAAGLTGQLEKGMRAFAINVDVASGVSGFVQPGDRVDIYWTGDAGNGEITQLIESAIKVIAVDQNAANQSGGATVARTVTVAATPEQVARLAQAQATGRLALSLVGTGDNQETGSVEVNSKDLLGIKEQVVVKAAPQRVCSIKTRKGGEVVEIPIPCSD